MALIILCLLSPAVTAVGYTGEIGADGVWSSEPLFLYNTFSIDYVSVTPPACFKPNGTYTMWHAPGGYQPVVLKEGIPFNSGYDDGTYGYIFAVTFNGENNCGQESSMSLSFGSPTGGTTRNITIKANPNARFCTVDVQPTLVDFSVLSPRSSDWAGVIKTINITPECSGTEAYTLAISGKNDGKYLATDGNLSFLLSDSGKDIDMSNGSAQLKSNVKEGSKTITISPRSSKATVEPGEYKAVMNLIISPI
ncbi:hypothetical protein AM629_18045 [Photorhabdus heterorhabditis]|uniref:Fimbrial protein n=2 Tax=Photorhabdus heterorhabditis TaxID=880156 RepID=A0ABR5K8G5_9GAMM|nr:hypothetical protein AM629_18045 [Photorhabdus heterorhabditis]